MISIDPFIHHKVIVLHQDATIRQAAHALDLHKIGSVMVADQEGHLVGIVTDRDLVCKSLARDANADQELSSVMTKNLVTIDEYANVADVVDLMENYGVRRIPVVRRLEKGKEKCIGMVTLDDLVASRSIDHIKLARIVQSQIFRRRTSVTGKSEAIRSRARSMAHSEVTMKTFINKVAHGTGLPTESALKTTRLILGLIAQRMHYTAAAHLISQLPRGLQDEMLDLPAGPDRTITAKSMIAQLVTDISDNEEKAATVLSAFWSTLEKLVDEGELKHVLGQLPKDIQLALKPAAEKKAA